jgi:hypothetical protein
LRSTEGAFHPRCLVPAVAEPGPDDDVTFDAAVDAIVNVSVP